MTKLAMGVLLMGSLCVGCSPSGSVPWVASPGAGGSGVGDAGAGGTDGAATPECGAFTMPNPASTGLPNPAAYTSNADGTVTDSVAGLTWEVTLDTGDYTQPQAALYCSHKAGGWRLPTRLELVSLVDFTRAPPGPTIDQTVFPSTPGAIFWTSTPFDGDAAGVWEVDFSRGDTSVRFVTPTTTARARCVQMAPPRCLPTRFQVQGGGVVLDGATGLTWQQAPEPGPYSQNDAKAYCTGLGAGWRLPSLTELQTIVDDRRLHPAIDVTAFPNTPDATYWTSSPFVGGLGAWFVYFAAGYSGTSTSLSETYQARCVR